MEARRVSSRRAFDPRARTTLSEGRGGAVEIERRGCPGRRIAMGPPGGCIKDMAGRRGSGGGKKSRSQGVRATSVAPYLGKINNLFGGVEPKESRLAQA
ncbi:hypothetical protein KM043_014612 [Ampulex compressa]|nr:hypothetical protein KM043_014612 [Ampulex compressa]